MSIAKAVVGRPVLTVVVFSLISIAALFLIPNVAIDMLPEIKVPMVMVYTTYPGASPEVVENAVTKPIEEGLANTAGTKSIKSKSQEQASIVFLEFDYGVDLDQKMNLARENLDKARGDIPQEATPMLMQFDPFSDPILHIAVRGNGIEQNELRKLAEDMVQDRLKQVDGVAQVSVEGGQTAVVRVDISANRLEAYSVTLTEIAGALAAQNMELGAGYIKDNATDYAIKTTGEYTGVEDIAKTVIRKINNAEIQLRDIGDVYLGYPEETASVYINGEKGVYVSIVKQSGANSVAVANRVYDRIEKIKRLLPPSVSLEITQDTTLETRAMISELINSAIQGIVLAMLVLLLFLRNIHSTLIVGFAIPFSFLVTLLVMSLTGITINMMTLTGLILGLGMTVDSSIVIIESVYKYRERGESLSVSAVLGGEEVMSSLIASTLTTLSVFLPVILFKSQLNIIGVMVEDLIWTIVISLVSSLFIAIFLAPVLASKYLPLYSRTQKPLRNFILVFLDKHIENAIAGLAKVYRKGLCVALTHKLMTIIFVLASFTGSILTIGKLPIQLMPDMDEDQLSMSVTMPMGTPYETTLDAMLKLESYARAEIKGVKSVIATVGSQGMSFDDKGTYTGDLAVKLTLGKEYDGNEAAKKKLRAHWNEFPNTVFSFGAGMMGDNPDISIILHIEDIKEGLETARQVVKLVGDSVQGVNDLMMDVNDGLPQLVVNIDRSRAYNFGLNIASIASEISAAMGGVKATKFRTAGDEYDVVLMLAEGDRQKIPDLDKILVRSGDGLLVPVSNFATLDKGFGPVSIPREDQMRVIRVTGNMQKGYESGDAEIKIQELLDRQGIAFHFDGENAEIQKMMQTFLLVIVLALLLIFGTMAGQYESFKDPFINFCTIPLIVLGVVAIHIITGQTLSAFTMMGFVMLAGIVVNNGILLVDYTNTLVRRGVPVFEAALDAGENRLCPVLMTALTTILGLVPMAFFPGASATMTQPIGLAIIGGLGSATLITLFFIPVLYAVGHGGKDPQNTVS
ncbi:multidrug ABC transporter [Fibrobacterales bacterium]|nr:multidrug ABC transporter [Fibrobacterales bacterium]